MNRPVPLAPNEKCACGEPAIRIVMTGKECSVRTPICDGKNCIEKINEGILKEFRKALRQMKRRAKESCQPSTCQKCKGCKK